MCSVLVFVVTAVPSCAESSNRNHWPENFRIGSDRIICKFVKRISDDQGRCATRFSFGFLKKLSVFRLRADCKVHVQFSYRSFVLYVPEIHADLRQNISA